MKRIMGMGLAAILYGGAACAEAHNPHGEDSKGLWQINASAKSKKPGQVKAKNDGKYIIRKLPGRPKAAP